MLVQPPHIIKTQRPSENEADWIEKDTRPPTGLASPPFYTLSSNVTGIFKPVRPYFPPCCLDYKQKPFEFRKTETIGNI